MEENSFGEGHGHFETVQKSHHYHFTCIGCRKVIELEGTGLQKMVQSLSELRGLQVMEIHMHFRGYCPGCQIDNSQ